MNEKTRTVASRKILTWDKAELTKFRGTVLKLIEMVNAFEVPTFAFDSLEVRRPDHGARVRKLKTAAKRVLVCANKVLSDDVVDVDAKEITEAVRDFKIASEELFSVESLAWIQLRIKLEDALKDPRIEFNPEVVKFVSSMLELVQAASGHLDYRSVLIPLENRLFSEHASRVAAKKNEAPRTWVRELWASRTDKGQSKASFARQYSPLVKRKFGLDVIPETISRDWLPKG